MRTLNTGKILLMRVQLKIHRLNAKPNVLNSGTVNIMIMLCEMTKMPIGLLICYPEISVTCICSFYLTVDKIHSLLIGYLPLMTGLLVHFAVHKENEIFRTLAC